MKIKELLELVHFSKSSRPELDELLVRIYGFSDSYNSDLEVKIGMAKEKN